MEKLFVIGLMSTGTSSLVGLLNSHENIFVMYEVDLKNDFISKYGKQILKSLPESRTFFNAFASEDFLYEKFYEVLKNSKYNDELIFFGDKLLKNDFRVANKIKNSKTIFMVRDIKTWLCKKQVKENYLTELDIVTPSINYLIYLINSFEVKQSMRIKMENLILNQEIVIENISEFLKVDKNSFNKRWWLKLGKYKKGSIKKHITWYKSHLSAHMKPNRLDLEAKLAEHKYWEEYLPIFKKYYDNLNKNFTKKERKKDVDFLENLNFKYGLIPLEAAFSNYEQINFKVPFKRRLKGAILNKFAKIIDLI